MKKYFEIMSAILISLCTACTKNEATGNTICLSFAVDGLEDTKAASMDENKIWDINLFVYDHNGGIVAHEYKQYSHGVSDNVEVNCQLLYDVRYEAYSLANIGYDMKIMTLDDLKCWKLYLTYPDGNLRGMAMAGHSEFELRSGQKRIEVAVSRLMAKVSLTLDCSKLSKGVSIYPSHVEVGNCPKSVYPFKESTYEDVSDKFSAGYSTNWDENAVVYLLESLGGNSPDESFSPYVSVHMDYHSDKFISAGSGLIYRFYLKDGDNYGVKRGNHYHITIRPEGDALGTGNNPFRIDSSNLTPL